MPSRESLDYSDPLDLLRRFIPSPLKFTCRIGTVHILVCTNDITLLPILPVQWYPNVPDRHAMEWKLIRDVDSRGPLQPPIVLASRDLTIITMGPACLLGFDRKSRELLGFVGADVDLYAYRKTVRPVLHQITQNAFTSSVNADVIFKTKSKAND